MADEKECRPTTTFQGISLREYIDSRFRDCEKVRDALLEGKDRALTKAEKNLGERLAGMNELGKVLEDQAGRFITRNELLGLVIGISTVISVIVSLVAMLLRK